MIKHISLRFLYGTLPCMYSGGGGGGYIPNEVSYVYKSPL